MKLDLSYCKHCSPTPGKDEPSEGDGEALEAYAHILATVTHFFDIPFEEAGPLLARMQRDLVRRGLVTL